MQMTVSGEHRSLHREEPGGSISPEFRAEFAVLCHTHGGGGGLSVRPFLPCPSGTYASPLYQCIKYGFPSSLHLPLHGAALGWHPPPPFSHLISSENNNNKEKKIIREMLKIKSREMPSDQ